MIGTDVSQASYIGNGATQDFSTVFPFFANAHVLVEKKLSGGSTFSVLTEGVDYTLTGADVVDSDGNRSAGNVHMTVAPAANDTLRITRNTPVLQLTHLRQQGNFLSTIHEHIADYSTCWGQDLERRLAVLEALGNLVTITAATGASFTQAFTTLDPIEDTFANFTIAVTGGHIAKGATFRLAHAGGDTDFFLGAPSVLWLPSGALNHIIIEQISGLLPATDYVISGMVFY